MHQDLGAVCSECGTVTIFGPRAAYPRTCTRCDIVLREAGPEAPWAVDMLDGIFLPTRPEAYDVDWLE